MNNKPLTAAMALSSLITFSLLASSLVGCSRPKEKHARKTPAQTGDVGSDTDKENNSGKGADAGDGQDEPEELPGGDDAGDDSGTPEIARLKPGIGVKNFRQINATMSALTTIPMTQPTVAAEYANLTTQLPETNDIRAFLGSNQVAIAKLAVEYCDAMVSTATALSTVLPMVNLSQTPAVGLNAAGRNAINKALIERFWGAGLASVPDTAQSLATLNKLTDELLVGKNADDASLTPNIVKALCTAVLASGPVTFQ